MGPPVITPTLSSMTVGRGGSRSMKVAGGAPSLPRGGGGCRRGSCGEAPADGEGVQEACDEVRALAVAGGKGVGGSVMACWQGGGLEGKVKVVSKIVRDRNAGSSLKGSI